MGRDNSYRLWLIDFLLLQNHNIPNIVLKCFCKRHVCRWQLVCILGVVMAGHEAPFLATCARSQITCSSGTQRNKMLRSQQHGTSRHSKTLAAHRSEHNKYSLLNVTAQLSQDITLKDTDLFLYESHTFCKSPFFIASNSCYCSYKVAVCANIE